MSDDELIAVLRWRGSTLQEGAFFEAADRIEQLKRELSISRMAQVVMDNTVETLTAERDAARTALKERRHD